MFLVPDPVPDPIPILVPDPVPVTELVPVPIPDLVPVTGPDPDLVSVPLSPALSLHPYVPQSPLSLFPQFHLTAPDPNSLLPPSDTKIPEKPRNPSGIPLPDPNPNPGRVPVASPGILEWFGLGSDPKSHQSH